MPSFLFRYQRLESLEIQTHFGDICSFILKIRISSPHQKQEKETYISSSVDRIGVVSYGVMQLFEWSGTASDGESGTHLFKSCLLHPLTLMTSEGRIL